VSAYELYIPSRNRADWLLKHARRSTLNQVAHLRPHFVIRHDDPQTADYVTYCSLYEARPVAYSAEGILGAAQTYDRIIDLCIAEGRERLVILDDDLTLTMANPLLNASPMYRLTTQRETTRLLQMAVDAVCRELPILTFTPIMARSQPTILSFFKPIMMAYVIYLPHFAQHPEHHFWMGSDIEARCDLNLSLRLLTEGYLTAFARTLFIPDNVNNPGGCSTYRDIECERASVAYLKAKFPAFVRTHTKRGWVGDPSVVREAPVISWQRAFDAARFKEHFGVSAVDFMYDAIRRCEVEYASFIKEIRDGEES
jgi:hypothetical protein